MSDNISAVLEVRLHCTALCCTLRQVYDEETCLETMRGYYETLHDQQLPPGCRCTLAGCEFDNQSNTYRLQVSMFPSRTKVITRNG